MKKKQKKNGKKEKFVWTCNYYLREKAMYVYAEQK